MSERYAIAESLLPAIAYGDAFGLPAEGKSAADIQRIYGGITELTAPIDHPFFPYETRGVTSDDTQLSIVVAESIIDAEGFSLENQASHHIASYLETPRIEENGIMVARGWGGSSIAAIERVIEGVSPEHSGQKDGAGNGIIMKMAPLAIWHAFQETKVLDRYHQYDSLTTMTHDSEIARICTRVHGDVIDALAIGERSLENVINSATEYYGERFPEEFASIYCAVYDPCHSLDELVERYAKGKSGKKYGFYVPETLAMTYDIFVGSRGDFQTAVTWAANLGGDADSTASIVASMIACASRGTFKRPVDFADVQEYEVIAEKSREFARFID